MKRADFSCGYNLRPVEELPSIFNSKYEDIVNEFLESGEKISLVDCSKTLDALYSGFDKVCRKPKYSDKVSLAQRQDKIYLVRL